MITATSARKGAAGFSFEITEEQRAFRDLVVRFAAHELQARAEHDAAGFFTRRTWEKCAELGIQGLLVPEEYGGAGADVMSYVIAMEAMGYGCHDNGLLFSLNAQILSCQHPILTFGSPEQKRRYLPGLAAGRLIAAHGMSEPGSGSDAFSLATTATPTKAGYVLNGSKTFVTNAPIADLVLVFATVDRSKGWGGLCAFLVDRDTHGLSVGQPLHKMGLQSSPMAEVFFDDCEIPASAMLGKVSGGMAIFNAGMERERSLILACALGTMQRSLERCLRHARERRQFGQPIGRFQSISNRIVEMKLRLETARLLLYRLAWLSDRGCSVSLDSALVKLYLSEAFLASSEDALRILGGYGYMAEYEVERDVRDAFAGVLYSGTSDIQRNLAARHLGI
ncbi:MAG TPA: acyl-CoA dehydrogenase family protein [Candidatus Dormibacteraeota bacterium]|nr:acyl-CoA dehydrogenase family protein [Candidatus Dormibacteraeota bacterium]